MIQIAQTDAEINACFPTIHQLRPHLDADTFLSVVRLQMGEGFQMAYLTENGQVLGVAGFRISHNLHLGKRLYVDDLVTHEAARGQGVGEKMFDWLAALALEQQCKALHLDSGVQRFGAHKFYLNRGMKIVCHHFLKELG
jgi:GNAT superfamily N-acetyltransferase